MRVTASVAGSKPSPAHPAHEIPSGVVAALSKHDNRNLGQYRVYGLTEKIANSVSIGLTVTTQPGVPISPGTGTVLDGGGVTTCVQPGVPMSPARMLVEMADRSIAAARKFLTLFIVSPFLLRLPSFINC
jgi:hypothetical protein